MHGLMTPGQAEEQGGTVLAPRSSGTLASTPCSAWTPVSPSCLGTPPSVCGCSGSGVGMQSGTLNLPGLFGFH